MKTYRHILNTEERGKHIRRRRKSDVDQALQQLSGLASKAWRKHLKRIRLQYELKRLRAIYREFLEGRSRIASILTGCLPVIGALILDILLLSAVAEFIVSVAHFESQWLVDAARLAVPFSIVYLELGLSTNLVFARRAADEWYEAPRKGDRRELRKWRLFSVLPMLVLISLVVATYLTGMEDELTGRIRLDSVSGLLLGAMALLSFLCHGVILYGGERALEGRDYVEFLMRQWWVEGRLHWTTQGYVRLAQHVVNQFRVYDALLEGYNNSYPHGRLAEGPFDNPVRVIVNSCFGYDVIPHPRVRSHAGEASEIVSDEPFPSGKGRESEFTGATSDDRTPRASGRMRHAKRIKTEPLNESDWNPAE